MSPFPPSGDIDPLGYVPGRFDSNPLDGGRTLFATQSGTTQPVADGVIRGVGVQPAAG